MDGNNSTLTWSASQWRLILSPPATGAWNMAVDEAILDHVGAGLSLPTLRLYTWQPGCLSLGFSQPVSHANQQALQQHGWHLVRRPTGGQAVLHIDELTYAVIAPLDEPRVKGSVLTAYRNIALALLAALRKLGLQPAADSVYAQEQENSRDPACFQNPSNYEITVKGYKLVGSAQARRADGVLQHGSIPIFGEITRVLFCLSRVQNLSAAQEQLRRHAANLESILGKAPDLTAVQAALVEGFASALNLNFTPPQTLTRREEIRAEELARTKYQSDRWTARV